MGGGRQRSLGGGLLEGGTPPVWKKASVCTGTNANTWACLLKNVHHAR